MADALQKTKLENHSIAHPVRLIRSVAKSTYFIHNMIVLAGTLLTGFCNYLINPVLTNLLGLAAYSKVVSLLGLLALLLIPIQIISTIVAKYTSSFAASGDMARLHDLIRRLLVVLLPLGCVATLIFIAFSDVVADFLHLPTRTGVIVVSFTLIFSFIGPVNGGALQGLQRFTWMSVTTVATPIIRLAAIVLFVTLGLGLTGAFLGVLTSVVLTYVLSLYPLRDLFAAPRKYSGALQSIGSYSITAAIALICTTLLANVDTILAGHFLVAKQAGQYDALAVIGRTVLFVSASVGTVMFPKAAALHERGEGTVKVVLQGLLGVLMLSVSAEIIFLLAPRLVISVLFHNNAALLQVSNQLAWYGFGMLMLALGQTLLAYFLSVGNRLFMPSVIISCLCETVLIVLRHSNVQQMVQAVVIANALLFITLFAGLIIPMRRKAGDRLALAS